MGLNRLERKKILCRIVQRQYGNLTVTLPSKDG